MKKAIAAAILLILGTTAGAEQGRTDWMPNARVALAVHWNQDLDTATKEFVKRGYEGIRNFEYYPFSDERNCDRARKVARDNASVKEEGCYAFVDGGFFAGWENNCRIYRFEFDRYTGTEWKDPQHPRNCHNMR